MAAPLEYRAVGIEEAAAALSTAAPLRAALPKRTRQTVAVLDDDARAWLDALPGDVAPRALARAFPRIVNELCALWKRPSRCDAYLSALMLDQRNGREGFPADVIRDLGVLVAHYEELYPTRRSHWLDVPGR